MVLPTPKVHRVDSSSLREGFPTLVCSSGWRNGTSTSKTAPPLALTPVSWKSSQVSLYMSIFHSLVLCVRTLQKHWDRIYKRLRQGRQQMIFVDGVFDIPISKGENLKMLNKIHTFYL